MRNSGNITVSEATVAAIDNARRENESRIDAADRIIRAALDAAARNNEACKAMRRSALLADLQRRMRLLPDEDLALLDELVLLMQRDGWPATRTGTVIRSMPAFGFLAQDAWENCQQRAAKLAAIEAATE